MCQSNSKALFFWRPRPCWSKLVSTARQPRGIALRQGEGRRPVYRLQQAAAAEGFVTTGCDETLWEHVYHPQRLAIVEKCIAVTGIIHHVKKEPDGDEHIQLQLDSQFEGLLNGRNRTAQADCLILEPICQNPVTQADAVDACRDFHSAVELPTESHAHVRVLGSYVLDTDKPGHGWMEIHPVTRIEVVQ